MRHLWQTLDNLTAIHKDGNQPVASVFDWELDADSSFTSLRLDSCIPEGMTFYGSTICLILRIAAKGSHHLLFALSLLTVSIRGSLMR